MKSINRLFAFSSLAGVAVAGLSLFGAMGACTVTETVEDDGAGGAGPTTNLLTDSERLSEAELTRRTYDLAAPELEGRAPATPGGLAARAYIIAEMQACGIEPLDPAGFEQPIATLAGAANVLGVIKGTDETLAARHVMVSAHYDHLGVRNGEAYLGADDNAVGVASILAIGCAIADSPQPRSVIIAAWDAEEPPYFVSNRMGSAYYVDNPVVPLAQTDVMIGLDLIGSDMWPGFQNHFLLGAEHSPQVQEVVYNASVPDGLMAFPIGLHLAEEWPDTVGGQRQPWSDYDAFRNASVPVLFLANAQTKRYHTPQDTADTLNYPKVALEAKLLLRITSSLANAETTPEFGALGPDNVPLANDFARDAVALQTVLEFALAPGGMVDSFSLTSTSRGELETNLANASAISSKMASGGEATEAEIRQLRDAAQNLLCLASSTFRESDCNFAF